MYSSWETPERKVEDYGLKLGVSSLSKEKIKKVITDVISNETGARLQAYYQACVRCGLCAQACHFCLSHDLDPTYAPVGKAKLTIWEMLEKKGEVSPEFMERAARIAFTECNVCKRCAMYCPLGIDTAYLMLVVRRICFKLDILPQYINDTVNSHAVTFNQMWVKDDEWIDTLQWQEEELREELPGARIPIEKQGAEIMYSVIGPEPKFQPQLIYQAAFILNKTGQDWTMPATPGWDNSDMAMYVRDDSLVARLKKQHFETALRLKVKKIVMGECGHAFRSVYDVGNRQLGWRMPPIPIVHAVEFYSELLENGKIELETLIDEPVTIHDPCNIVRGRGLHELLRQAVHKCCTNVIEMIPNREHNYCCAAGGGVINCGPIFKESRLKGNKIKAEQLRRTGAKIIVSPCHNCHSGLEDIVKYYDLDMEVLFLSDIIYRCMKKD